MKARRLLHILESRDVKLWAEGDRLKWDTPKGIITDEIKARMRGQKTELLALLQCKEADDYRENLGGKGFEVEKHLVAQSKDTRKLPDNKVILGDCLEKLRAIPDGSVDLLTTDPPYGISFMGKDWDKAIPSVDTWKECLRVLKPGAFALVMSIPRQDCLARMIVNLENAGFKIDYTSLYWTYATGFPKAHNISKAIDKKFGAERKVIGKGKHNKSTQRFYGEADRFVLGGGEKNFWDVTAPATKQAKTLEGSYAGFQPKPAVEIIIVAMKPLSMKTYTEQALSNGKGIMWMDDCRIPYKTENEKWNQNGGIQWSPERKWNNEVARSSHEKGRFPANLLVSDNVLDDGKTHFGGGVGGRAKHGRGAGYGFKPMRGKSPDIPKDKGTYSRFFSLDAWAEKNLPFLIIPKPSRREKEMGLTGFDEKKVNDGRNKAIDNAFQRGETPRRNTNPCVKPVKLMAYLIKMGSYENDVVLDPYCGTGSTCMAAKLLNRRYIGIEICPEYHEIAIRRIDSVEPIKRRGISEAPVFPTAGQADDKRVVNKAMTKTGEIVVLKPQADEKLCRRPNNKDAKLFDLSHATNN